MDEVEPLDTDDALLEEMDPSAESEEDLHSEPGQVSEAVVTSTDWTVGTLLEQLERGNIQLNPRFQRRDAWTSPRKSRFIESLFLGLPIPQLVLAERSGERGSFIVIDGKQRLLALRQFAAADSGGEFEQLQLRGLEVLADLNGFTLSELSEAPGRDRQLAAFENQTVRTMVVRNWPDDDFLYRVFLRLNTGSVPLAPQELRQALLPGPFTDFAEEFSADSAAIRSALRLHRPDFRMRDVELLIRYYAFANFLDDYAGNLKAFLDLTCDRLNKSWSAGEEQIRTQGHECEAAISATESIFSEGAFRRWSGDRWERPFNRAVFDVMVFYFRTEAVRSRASARATKVVQAFRHLSENDEGFQESLQTTTKSISATHRRLSLWGEGLSAAINCDLNIPELEENRIHLTS